MQPAAAIDHALPFRDALWVDVIDRSTACPHLSVQDLLHAGPPFRAAPPAPVAEAAVQALLYEGLAVDRAAAHALLAGGTVRLLPAQDHGVASPLAQVISASMPLVVVQQGAARGYAPVVEGPAPALRFGSVDAEAPRRLQRLGETLRAGVAPLLEREPPAIDALIRIAIAAGDECHARTGAANEAMVAALRGLDAGIAAVLRSNPGFVLALLMAAAAAALRTHGSAIEAIGGNGHAFGVRWQGDPEWRQMPADAPRGSRFAGFETRTPLGAIGDSALIDFCGLGGQALAAAPLLAAEWAAVLPPDALSRRSVLIDPRSGLVDPRRVAQSGLGPLIDLAILDRDGAGLIGRGCYGPPAALFAADSRIQFSFSR
jgi:hypothetical protein